MRLIILQTALSVDLNEVLQNRHSNVFLSLSTAVNGRSPNHRALIAACSPDRILVESDIHQIDDCVQRTWDMVLIVAAVKGWPVETVWEEDIEESQWGVVRRLEKNWREFVQGSHAGARQPSKRQ
jgi:hypothetical protein